MALAHAHPMDVIRLGPLGESLRDTASTSLIRTDSLQLLHLVLKARSQTPEHDLAQECVIHCLEGDVEVATPGGNRRLGPGHLVLLPAGQRYSLSARGDSAVLVTLPQPGAAASPTAGQV